jgi:hypothetical protein
LRRNGKAHVFFLIALLLPPLAILFLTVLLPVAINPFEESADETLQNVAESVTDSIPAEIATGRRELSHKMLALEIEQAFWQTRLRLAKSDSISLAINLVDSTVSLDIKGVPVRICKIHRYKTSGATTRLRAQGRLLQWLSQPFILQKELATLPKAPIRIMEAPEDTIEANEMAAEEPQIEKRDVHFTFHFDRHLSVSVNQVQRPSFAGRVQKVFYNLRRSFSAAGNAVISLFRLQLPEHRIWLELELSREDAKAIYRALPPQARMALRL